MACVGRRTSLLLATAISMAACEQPSLLMQPRDPSALQMMEWRSERESLPFLTRVVATAVEDPRVRKALRDALRASPFTEHKLTLWEYLQTNDGRQLVATAARGLGITPESIDAAAAAAPPLDLYLPFRDHRRTWRGTADIRVAYSPDPDNNRLNVITASPNVELLEVGRSAPKLPLLVLHPAEPKSRRINPQPLAKGEVVEDPDDGQIGVTIIKRDAQGNLISITEVADRIRDIRVASDCNEPMPPPDCDDGGGGGGGLSLTQAMTHFGDGVGSAEVEWQLSDDSHVDIVRVTGLNPFQWRFMFGFFWGAAALDGPGLVHATETDAVSDDNWGEATLNNSQLGTVIQTWGLCALIGDPNTQSDPLCDSGSPITVTTEIVIQ